MNYIILKLRNLEIGDHSIFLIIDEIVDLFRTSTFCVLRPTDFTNLNLNSTSLVRPKLYFDLYFSATKKSRCDKKSK